MGMDSLRYSNRYGYGNTQSLRERYGRKDGQPPSAKKESKPDPPTSAPASKEPTLRTQMKEVLAKLNAKKRLEEQNEGHPGDPQNHKAERHLERIRDDVSGPQAAPRRFDNDFEKAAFEEGVQPRARKVWSRQEGMNSDDAVFASPPKEAKWERVSEVGQKPGAAKDGQATLRQPAPQQQPAPQAAAPKDHRSAPARLPAPNATEQTNDANSTKPEDAPLLLRSEHSDLELQVPASINHYLQPYQREGIQFLFRQYSQGIGGVLADDMGLGKTVQTISFLSALLGKDRSMTDNLPRPSVAGKKRLPILIVCPPTVLDNWGDELCKWGAIKFTYTKYAGKWKESAANKVAFGNAEIMLVGYESYRIDSKIIHEIPWHAVVFDEAHKLKNNETQIYKAASSIPTKLRYLLTGTVMPNEFGELWNILDFAVPGCLGERKAFMEFYAEPLKRSRQISAKEHTLEKGQERQDKLHNLLGKYLLRRRKDTTIPDKLPKKTDNIVFCKMTELQLRAYKRVLASPEMMRLQASFDECTCNSGVPGAQCCYKGAAYACHGPLWLQYHDCQCEQPYHPYDRPDGCKWHRPDGCGMCPMCITLPALQILRKISNHLDLVKADLKDCGGDRVKLARQKAVAEMCLGEDAEQIGGAVSNEKWLDYQNVSYCGKLQALKLLLTLWSRPDGEKNKVLLFSNSVKMLDRIDAIAISRGYDFFRLDGSTERKERQKMVDTFNASSSSFLFLISTGAGGVGLNLASANKVVIIDPSWNPASDLQAIDRAYRLGSKKDVNVYRFVSAGTIEEIMYSRQVYKQQQANVAVENMQEPRYFDAVQKESGIDQENGELFGLANIFKLSARKVQTCEIIDNAQGKPLELPFNIEEVDPSKFAKIKAEPNAPELPLAEAAGEDKGLTDLASLITASQQEAAIIQGNGVLKSLRHDEILGAKGMSKIQQRGTANQGGGLPLKVEGASAAVTSPQRRKRKGHSGAGGEVPAECMPLQSLANWQRVTPVDMARRILSISAAERSKLRDQYAGFVKQPLAE